MTKRIKNRNKIRKNKILLTKSKSFNPYFTLIKGASAN